MGANLRYWREARGLGVNALGSLAGVAPSMISALELGGTNATYGTMMKLARALGVGVEYLWDHHPPPAPPVRSATH